MPRPLPGEIAFFARVLQAFPETEREIAACRLLVEAKEANTFRLANGRSHPDFGDGSLVSRLMKLPVPTLDYGDDPEFLDALCIVARAVLNHNVAKTTSLAVQ